METERKNNNLKTRQALDLPKIDQQTYLKTIISPQQRRVIQISDEFSKKNRFTAQSETTKNPKMESSENPKTSKLYFFKQQLSSTMKKYTSHSQSSEVNAKNFLSFSKTHQTDYDLWKKEELKKIKDSKDSKDLANDLILSDKIIRKNTIMNPSLFMKSNLAQIDFNKLSQKSIQKLPKAEISSEKIKENLKEYIGINKYPIDYKEVNLDIPKSNFIEFELLKTHMSNFIVNYEKKSKFEEDIQEGFHKSQTVLKKTSFTRRDMIGLAQWLDKSSDKIFGEDLTSEEQLANIQQIYTIGITEIVEIISKECQERGILLQNIWNIHTSLVNACLTRYEHEKNNQYSKFLDEIEKIKNSYSSCFDGLMKESKEARAIIESRDFAIKKLAHDNNSLRRKEIRLNKTILCLGDAIEELKEMFDAVLTENIKLKLSKEEESNLRKGEREILKRQYEDMLKSKNRMKEGIFYKLEKLMKKSSHGHSPAKDLLNSQKSFTFDVEQIDSGTFNTLNDFEKDHIREENDDSLNDLDKMGELFTKEIGVDTKDLLPVNNKETSTKDLGKYFMKEQSAQTVYFDEISDENENVNSIDSPDDKNEKKLPIVDRKFRGSYINTSDIMVENLMESKNFENKGGAFDKQFFIRKRMFSFSKESLQHLEKFKEIQSYTLTGICDWYSNEIQSFFKILESLKENIEKEDLLESFKEFDWFNFHDILINIKLIHEQFIKNIKNRDTTRSKEILQHKIELLERKIEMDEAEKMRNIFRNNYNKLREKFEEFYKMTIKIQSFDEDDENEHNPNTLNPNMTSTDKNTSKRRKSMTTVPEGNTRQEINKKKGKTLIKPKKIESSKKFIEKTDVSYQASSEKEYIENLIPRTKTTVSSKILNEKSEEKELIENPVSRTKTMDPINKFTDLSDKISESKRFASYSIKKQLPRPSPNNDTEKDSSTSAHSIDKPSGLNIQVLPAGPDQHEVANFLNEIKIIEEDKEKEEINMNSPISAKKPSRKITNKEKTMINQSYMLRPNNINERSDDIRGILEQVDREKNEFSKMEEKKMKEQQEFKDMIANEKMIDMINQANNVLPKKKIWDKINSQNADKCYAFLHRIEVSEITSSKKVTLGTVLRTISQVLTELVKIKQKKQGNLNPLFFILYEFLFQRYGNMRDQAESKMIKIFQGCKSHMDLPRVRNFARLLSIITDKTTGLISVSDGNDLEFYLHYFMLLDDNPMTNMPGMMLAMSPQDHAFTALAKAMDVFTKFCGNYQNVSKVKIENAVNQIKATKLDDPIVSRKYVVDVDFVLEKIFEIRDEAFKIYRLPFLAVDIDGNDALNINKFMLLLRNIERKKLSENRLLEIFKNEYDFYDEEKDEKCMSFKRFAFVCERENIIGLSKQKEFELQTTDELKNINLLRDEWDVKKNLIKLKLIKTNYYNSFYIRLLKIIEAYLNQKNPKDEETKIAWLRYRVIDEESNGFLLQYETESCLPKDFNLLAMKAAEIL